MSIISELSRSEKRKLRIWIQREVDAGMRTRMSIILHLSRGKPVTDVAGSLHVARSTVYRVAKRFRVSSWPGLADYREDNGPVGVGASFLLILRHLVANRPSDFGWARPTWTQELLVETMVVWTGIRVSRSSLSRYLAQIEAHRKRPRPVLRCPWSKVAQTRRIRQIHRLIGSLPDAEVAVWSDEVDIHLNPKIGFDWMLRGQQKEVLTPGQNVKRYLAGALDATTGRMHWVTDTHKRSGLFIALLRHLNRRYREARVIHVVVDNYSIHRSRQTQMALRSLPRIRLHFLPPYSPKFNPIERKWLDLHAEVTRNHGCATIDELMSEVENHLRYRNRNGSCTPVRSVA